MQGCCLLTRPTPLSSLDQVSFDQLTPATFPAPPPFAIASGTSFFPPSASSNTPHHTTPCRTASHRVASHRRSPSWRHYLRACFVPWMRSIVWFLVSPEPRPATTSWASRSRKSYRDFVVHTFWRPRRPSNRSTTRSLGSRETRAIMAMIAWTAMARTMTTMAKQQGMLPRLPLCHFLCGFASHSIAFRTTSWMFS